TSPRRGPSPGPGGCGRNMTRRSSSGTVSSASGPPRTEPLVRKRPHMNDIRVGILGHAGKMGSETVRAVEAAPGLEVAGGVDHGDSLDVLEGADVVVDFTHPDVVMDNIEWALTRGIHMVVGTTGFTVERLRRVRELCDAHPGVGILIASNFSVG